MVNKNTGWNFLILILFCCFLNNGYSQRVDDTYNLSEYGVRFSKPRKFKYTDNAYGDPGLEYFYTSSDGRKKNILPSFYLHNRDSSILILVEAYSDLPTQEDILTPYWFDPNRFAFNSFFSVRDTTFPVKYYSSKDLSKTNADWIAESTPYFGESNTFGEYRYSRSVVFNKYDQIYFHVTYLFKESSKDRMEKLLESTRLMFRFKDVPKAPAVSMANYIDQHYAYIDEHLLCDSLSDKWNKGIIYQNQYHFWGEDLAFERDGMVISVKFPTNDKWPYMNHIYQEQMDTVQNIDKWRSANAEHEKYLVLAKGVPHQYSTEESQKLNADEGYIFDFSHDRDDLYRGKYKDCKVLLIHRRNV